MAEIGFSLYTELLERAVKSIKAGHLPDVDLDTQSRGAEVELHLAALIPEDYLPDVHTRLTLYKRLSAVRTADELREMQVEMIDRFGLLPNPAKHLFAVTELKLDATQLGIRKLNLGATGGLIQFVEKPNIDPMAMIQLIQNQPQHYRMDGPSGLRVSLDLADPKTRIHAAQGMLLGLAKR